MTTISNNKLPEWRKTLNKSVENYQSMRAWYEENPDNPSAEQDMNAAEGEIEKLIKQYGVLIVLNLLDEIDELQERRKADSEPAGYHVIKECGKVGCSVATLEEAEKTRDFWNKKWIIKPYFYAPPVQETGVYKDMLNIINLLENNEWAEHCTGTVLGSLLESEITRLVSKEQSAPVIPDGWISCSERMPEDEQEVIVHNKLGYRYVSYFDEHSGLFFDMRGGNQMNCIEHILVTHWMPLPAAPEPEQS